MGIISRLGRWLDTRFPEKMTVEEVNEKIKVFMQMNMTMDRLGKDGTHLLIKVNEHEDSIKELQDEMNKAKVVIAMTQQMRQVPVMKSGEPWKR